MFEFTTDIMRTEKTNSHNKNKKDF